MVSCVESTCAQCGEQFQFTPRRGPRPRCCSAECGRQLRTELYQRKIRLPDLRCCLGCGKEFSRATVGQTAKYCSRECRPKPAARLYQSECTGCGCVTTSSHAGRKWCDDCRPAPNPAKSRTCQSCGVAFILNDHKRFYKYRNHCEPCWRECNFATKQAVSRKKKRMNAALRRLSVAARGTKGKCAYISGACGICGCNFTARAAKGKPCKCCSDECHAEHRRRARREKKKRIGTSYRSRARKHGVDYESLNRVSVYERDGWVCGICGDPVDKDLEYPDEMSASLDHVVPMACGGGHVLDNVQCSHWICNVLKSDSLETTGSKVA